MARLREVRAWRERLGKAHERRTGARRARQRRRGVSASACAARPRCSTSCPARRSSSERAASARRRARRRSRRRVAERGERHSLLSTDPAAALGDVLGAPVGSDAIAGRAHRISTRASSMRAVAARRVPRAMARRHRARSSIAARISIASDVDGLVDAALPGVDEIFALLALADLLADATRATRDIVVDTAPTGHTLRLLALPETFDALVCDARPDAGQASLHGARAHASLPPRRADAFLARCVRASIAHHAALGDRARCAAVVVTRDEPWCSPSRSDTRGRSGRCGIRGGCRRRQRGRQW